MLNRRCAIMPLVVALLTVPLGCDQRGDTGDTDATDELAAAAWSASRPDWGPHAHLQSSAISECSGIVRSRRHADAYWVHNDSGDEPRIFAIDGSGRLLAEYAIAGASHVDWEDIAADDHGHLFVCDLGNNRNQRRDLVIYVVEEPDSLVSGTLEVAYRLPIAYPDQSEFPDPRMNHDCEAVFWRDGDLYLLSKHRSDHWTRLYRLDDVAAAGTAGAEKLVPALIDSVEIGSMVTGADLSPDGRQLAVQTYEYVVLFDLPAASEQLLSQATARRLLCEMRQSEAISHEGEVIRVVNEQGEIHLLDRAAIIRCGRLRAAAADPATGGSWRDEGTHGSPASGGPLRGYLPERPSVTLEPGRSVALALRSASHGDDGADLNAPDIAPPTAAVRCDDGRLRLDVTLPLPDEHGTDAATVMVVAWGPVSERPRPEAGDQVWRLVLADGEVGIRRIAGADDDPTLEHALTVAGGQLSGHVVLPRPATASQDDPTHPHQGQDSCTASTALNLNLFPPAGGEWYWGGDASMFAPMNPFLWGEVRRAAD